MRKAYELPVSKRPAYMPTRVDVRPTLPLLDALEAEPIPARRDALLNMLSDDLDLELKLSALDRTISL